MTTSNHDPRRRALMAAVAAMPLGGVVEAVQAGPDKRQASSRVLVAYFSRTGNTRVVAGLIHRGLNADLFELRAASAYPEDYLETVEQAKQERDSGFTPPLQQGVSSMSDYETVFLAFPIWGGTTPPIVRTFLASHDLSGKVLIPVITHGGYGTGDSRSVIAKHAPQARLQDGFVMEADQERQTMNRVNDWIGRL